MVNKRKKTSELNVVTSLTGQMISIACGIILPWLMIGAFGSEAYGATTSITQFLAYITLLEGGIGGVARAALYKPLAQNDMQVISAIMREVKRFFLVIAWIFVGYVLIIACCFKTISNITCMDWISTFMLVIVISISTFGQYFIGISNAILLQAHQKTYIPNTLNIGGTILNAVCTIVLIKCNCHLIVVKLVSSLIYFMRPVMMSLYVKKNYNLNWKKTHAEKIYLTQKWTGLGQHIAYFLHSNTDIAILTVFANLRIVAVYSVYNMIMSHLQSLVISFSSGMEAVFGDMLARDEERQLHNTFQTYETILSLVSIIFFSVATVLMIPFVRLYTAGVTDANYIQPLFALLVIFTAFSYCMRHPYHSMVIAAGHFRETRVAAYGEAIINIVLSIILVFKYNLLGVSIATFVATWFRFIFYVIYLSKNIFYRKLALFVKRLMINVSIFGCNCLVGYNIIKNFVIHNFIGWMFCGGLLVIVTSLITLGIYSIFFRKDCCSLIRRIIKR